MSGGSITPPAADTLASGEVAAGQLYDTLCNLTPPTFGLNFLENKKSMNTNFMLLCGFEKFDKYFVRIDILERLFVKIINSNLDNKGEIKLIPEMLNLLGCSKDNFLKLIREMNYKTYTKNNEIFFKYSPLKIKSINNKKNDVLNSTPFEVLKNIHFK